MRSEEIPKSRFERVLLSPGWIAPLELRRVADPPDMIADAVLIAVRPAKLLSSDVFAQVNRFKHRATIPPASADVEHFGNGGSPVKLQQRADEIVTMNVVAHLLCLVSAHDVWNAFHTTFHQIREEAMQWYAGMRRSGQTSASKTGGRHAEVSAVFLNEKIRRCFRHAKQTVRALIEAHALVDTAEEIRMFLVN